jgi:hypothetical protein
VILSQLAFDKKYRDLGLIEATVDTGEAPRCMLLFRMKIFKLTIVRLDADKFKG